MKRALEAARQVDAPEWLIGAGAIRTVVWDVLHGRREPAPPRDVDLVFFDRGSLEPEREADVRAHLLKLEPDLPWDVKNQA